MINKNIKISISFLVFTIVIFMLFFDLNNSNGFSCYNENITLTNSSNFICTSQWVIIEKPVSIINESIIAKGLFINNTFSITGNSTLNISTIINKGNATINATLIGGNIFENYRTLLLEKPIFINFSYFLNKGLIIDKNYLNNGGYSNTYFSYDGNNYGCKGESYPFSYAGSGGGSLATYSQCNGGNTLVTGGLGQVTSYINHVLYPIYNSSGNHVYLSPSNYSFNLSLLSSSGGASYNSVNNTSLFMRGSSGVLPLIIISKSFNNVGSIYNQGQSINYSAIKNASKFLAFGIVGAGGGGVIEVISDLFINNGTFNVIGGKIYLNGSLGLPSPYTTSNLGYGGNGNVFFFKANNKLLLNSIHNYNWGLPSQSAYNPNSSSNLSNKIQNYSVTAKLEALPDCSLNGIYINLKGYYNNNSFTKVQPISDPIFWVNRSNTNLSLFLSGNNPLIHYYSNLSIILSNASNTSIETLNLSQYLPVNINFLGSQNLSFKLLKNSEVVSSGISSSGFYSFELEQGKYSLLFEDGSSNYTYGLYVAPNCLGYENIAISPGKSYYLYDSLNVSSIPFIYNANQTVREITSYQSINSCNFNISVLIDLDKSILSSLSSMNSSISSVSSNKINYANILSEINYTNYVLTAHNTKIPQKPQNVSLNQSGLTILSYYNTGNFTKEVLQLSSNGTINLSYGANNRIQIVVTKENTQNIFVSTEKDIIKVFSYVPSLFLGFLGGL